MARRVPIASLMCLAMLLAACGLDTANQYVQSDEGRLSFRLPHAYTAVPIQPGGVEWIAGLDASPQPSVDHADMMLLDHPFVVAQVVDLDSDVRANISQKALRTFALDDGRDPLDDHDDIRVAHHQPLLDDRGFEGHWIQFDIDLEGGTATEAQLVALSPDRSTIHRVRVACSATCFADNLRDIESILDSVVVKP